jgi:hypothetical protein
MKTRTVIALSLVVGSGLFAEAQGQTADGAAFLKIGMGGRALAMGGAFVAVADEAGAGYWNPAGLDLAHHTKMEASYSRLSLARHYDTGALSQPLGRYGSLGLGWMRFGVDMIELRTGDTSAPDGYGKDDENAYLVSYSKSVLGFLGVGITGKYITQNLLGKHATATGADLGLLLKMTNGWSVGLVTQNIDADLSWPGGHKDPLPRVTKWGIAYQTFGGKLIVTCDRVSSNQERTEIRFGTEGKVSRTWSLRGGYGHGEVSLGTGVLAPLPWAATRLDYVFGTDRLGQHPTHRFALAVSL